MKKIENSKKAGIWMDHASAHLIEFTTDPIETKTIESQFTHAVKEETLQKSESLMNHKEQHEEAAYYKKLGEIIDGYTDIVLFGPTEAKTELFNILCANRQFENIKIEVKQTDKMTENQQHAFVRAHFSNENIMA